MEATTLSHYSVLEKLGGGGMGVVYKALDTKLNRHVALKFLPPELTRDEDTRERFILEAQTASALDHPNICAIHEIDTTPEGQQFIAMAYCEGETLKQRIARGPLPIEDALDIAIQVAQGLADAHDSGIIHRDIKPANLIITKDGLVKIVDFGIAKLVGVTGPTQTGTTLGTVSYMSPEQVAGDDADQQSDVWSLGVVLHEMITGQPAFKGETQWAVMNAIRTHEPEAPASLNSDVPSALSAIVARALEKTRENRWPSADAFVKAAKSCQSELSQPAAPVSLASAWRMLATPTGAAAAVGVLAVVAAGFFWMANRGADARWARDEALPEIRRLVATDDYVAALGLAEEAARFIGDHSELLSLWPRMSVERGFDTTVPGADVSYRPFAAGEDEWVSLGSTPIDTVRVPQRSPLEGRAGRFRDGGVPATGLRSARDDSAGAGGRPARRDARGARVGHRAGPVGFRCLQ